MASLQQQQKQGMNSSSEVVVRGGGGGGHGGSNRIAAINVEGATATPESFPANNSKRFDHVDPNHDDQV